MFCCQICEIFKSRFFLQNTPNGCFCLWSKITFRVTYNQNEVTPFSQESNRWTLYMLFSTLNSTLLDTKYSFLRINSGYNHLSSSNYQTKYQTRTFEKTTQNLQQCFSAAGHKSTIMTVLVNIGLLMHIYYFYANKYIMMFFSLLRSN